MSMSVWQYAQLTITHDSRVRNRRRTVLWHGPGAELAEDLSESEPRVLDLLNRVGADGWELTSQEEQRQNDGHSYWDAAWSLTTYTFKRRVELQQVQLPALPRRRQLLRTSTLSAGGRARRARLRVAGRGCAGVPGRFPGR